MTLVDPSKWINPREDTLAMFVLTPDPRASFVRPQRQVADYLPACGAQCWSTEAESDVLLRWYSRVEPDALLRHGVDAQGEGVRATSTWSTLQRVCDVLDVSTFKIARWWATEAMDVPDNPGSVPGLRIRPLRRARGITLVRLLELTGVSVATLSRFERGVTASRLLVDRPGRDGDDYSDRDQVLSSLPLARALGFADLEALRAACGGQREEDDADDDPALLWTPTVCRMLPSWTANWWRAGALHRAKAAGRGGEDRAGKTVLRVPSDLRVEPAGVDGQWTFRIG